MTHPIIKTDNYLLFVDELSNVKDGDYSFYWNQILKVQIGINYSNPKAHKKIIFHLPLNNAPVLEGVPLLPPLEDDVELAYQKELLTDNQDKNWVGYGKGINGVSKERWKSIYNKAKEKYKYTEEDLRKALSESFKASQEGYNITCDEIIQSLQQQKYPVAFELKMKVVGITDDGNNYIEEPKTITNSQGLIQVVGKYIYATS
jgi:hypothetical protein